MSFKPVIGKPGVVAEAMYDAWAESQPQEIAWACSEFSVDPVGLYRAAFIQGVLCHMLAVEEGASMIIGKG